MVSAKEIIVPGAVSATDLFPMTKSKQPTLPLIILLTTAVLLASLFLIRTWQSNQIAFLADYESGKSGLYRVNLLWGKPKLISPGYVGNPQWSPDGKKIVFVSAVDEVGRAPYHIYVMNVDGSDQTQITDLNSNSPAWHP